MAVVHPDRRLAERALGAAFAELALVERVMSLYLPESQLSRLNLDRVLSDPHPYLVDVLARSRAISQASGGAFDVTMQPLWELFAAAKQAGRLPEPDAIEAAKATIDWRRVEVSPERISLTGKATKVTLNGIAQGFAADRAMDALRRHGIEHALVDTGEIGSLGDKTPGRPWIAGIRHPRSRDAHLALADLAGRCLATSGDYATRFSDDYCNHHIFDPATGRSPTTFSSVSVAAPTAVEADALSTAVFVLGVERGLALVRSTGGADALLVLKDGRTLATERFPVDAATTAGQT
jgi:thiamine biosynthesis lipoprotein